MIRALGIMLALIWAASGEAQAQASATLRSGEHDDFTRLAFRAPDRVEWTVTRLAKDQVRLDFTPDSFRIDAPDVFARIGRDRVRAIETDDASVVLDLGCDCPVLVRQLASGFVAIDVVDPPAGDNEPERASESVRLPLRFEPLSMPRLEFGFETVAQATGDTVSPFRRSPEDDSNANLPPQIALRPASMPRGAPQRPAGAACAIETRAAEILGRDPIDALDQAIVSRGAISDASDRLDVAALMKTAEAFLAAGFGAEADALFASGGRERDFIDRRIARALDGESGEDLAALADCGPATATLHMLSPQHQAEKVADPDLLRFLDGLPAARRQMLLPRLGDLRRDALGQSYIASELRNPEPEARVAGTNGAAVEAVIATLDRDWNPAGDKTAAHLENALALRQSVPEGRLRDRLDTALLRRLIETGHAANAAALLSDRPDLATLAIDHALSMLGEPAAIEALTYFAPTLPEQASHHQEAAALMRRYGLDRLARRFSTPYDRPVDGPRPQGDELNPWLTRDFAAMAEAPDTPRAALASELRRRNAAEPATGDFARARRAVADATRILAAIDPVLQAQDVEAEAVTPP